MTEPRFFPDEIAERLNDLKHGDSIIIRHGQTEEVWTCNQTARYEDGLVDTWRWFVTAHGSLVDRIIDRLYDASESGYNLTVVISGERQPF